MTNHFPLSTKRQNTFFAWLVAWPVIGVFCDGWHHHHLDIGMDGLFNPYHLFLYAGIFACAVYIAGMAYSNIRKGYTFRKSLPHMYSRAAWGIGFFILAVACDLTWHHIFGFELSIDALLSPPHLFIGFSGMLAVSCLLRPIWHKEREQLVNPIVPVLGFIYLFLTLIFLLQYCHPYYELWLSEGSPAINAFSYVQAAALAGGMLRTVVFCGMLFTTLRYFRFPAGTMFAALVAEAVGIGFMGGQFQYIGSAIVAGILTEIIYHYMYPHLNRHVPLRVFGFLIPIAFFLPYVGTTLILNASWWSIHTIIGLVFVNGVVGWLLTYLIVPPKPHDYPQLDE